MALFKGYHTNPDRKLTKYTKRKKDEFKENGRIMVPETLMENMNNKYLILLENNRFNKPSKMEAKIVALQTLVHKKERHIKDNILTLSRRLIEKLSKRKSSGTTEQEVTNKQGQKYNSQLKD